MSSPCGDGLALLDALEGAPDAHVASCPGCRAALSDMRRVRALARAVGRQRVQPRPPARPRRRVQDVVSAMAAVVLAVLSLDGWFHGRVADASRGGQVATVDSGAAAALWTAR